MNFIWSDKTERCKFRQLWKRFDRRSWNCQHVEFPRWKLINKRGSIYRRPLIIEKHLDHIPEQSRTQAETHWGLQQQQHLNRLATPTTWVWRTMPTWKDLGRSCRRRGRGWRGWRKRWGRRFLSWKYILLGNNRWRRGWGKRHKAKGRGGKVGDLQGFMSNQDIQCWNQDQDLQG